MSSTRGLAPLSYRRISRAELAAVTAVELDPDQVSRFLGPVEGIVSAVEHGLAHSMIAMSAQGALVGFYVVHPDLRDTSCWWLGWLAVDRRSQGCGFGRSALLDVMERLRRMPGCRRIRLLVAPDNGPARSLYQQAGFEPVGFWAGTGELILQRRLPDPAEVDGNEAFVLLAVAARARRVFRAPPAAADRRAARRVGDRGGARAAASSPG